MDQPKQYKITMLIEETQTVKAKDIKEAESTAKLLKRRLYVANRKNIKIVSIHEVEEK